MELFRTNSQNIDTQSGITKPKYGTISYYIYIIENSLKSNLMNEFHSNLEQFSLFSSSKYLEYAEKSDELFFINELFDSVSLARVHNNYLLYSALVSSLIDANIGDKTIKANKISRDVSNIPPDPNPLIYFYLKKILGFLSRILRTMTQQIIQPLLGFVWKWTISSENDTTKAGFRLFLTLYEGFYHNMEPYSSNMQSILAYSLQIQDYEVRKISNQILKLFIEKQDKIKSQVVAHFISKIYAQLNGTIWRYFDGCIEVGEMLLDLSPSSINSFHFSNVPIKLLSSKDKDIMTSGMKVIPFILMTNSTLLSQDDFKDYLKIMTPHTKKKQPFRNLALLTLGKSLFFLSKYSESMKSYILKIYDNAKDLIDCDGVFVFMLASASVQCVPFNEVFNRIFVLPLTEYVMGAIRLYQIAHPDHRNLLYERVLASANSTIFCPSSHIDSISDCLFYIDLIGIPMSFFSVPLVLRYCEHLSSSSDSIRNRAFYIIVKFYNQSHSIEVLFRILVYINSETSTHIRRSLFGKIAHYQFDSSLSLVFKDLLNSDCPLVLYGTINYLCRVIYDTNAYILVKNYLFSCIKLLKDFPRQSRVPMKTILMITREAYHNSSNEENNSILSLIKPYADFLIESILSESYSQGKTTMLLLSILFRVSNIRININLLVNLLTHSLNSRVSSNRLEAALDLFYASLQFTDLKITIYKNHFFLYMQLIELSGNHYFESVHTKILKVLSFIGPIKIPENFKLSTKVSKISAISYISKSNIKDPQFKLMEVCNHISITMILDVLSNETISTLHNVAIETLLVLLKLNRQIGKDLELAIIEKFQYLLLSPNPSTANLVLTNISTFITVLGDSSSALVPMCVDFITKHWKSLDKVLLIRMCEWIMISHSSTFLPFLPKIALIYSDELDNCSDVSLISSLLSSFVTFGDAIKSVDFVIIPSILRLLHRIGPKQANILDRLFSILIRIDTKKYFIPITRALMAFVQEYPESHDQALKILIIIAVHTGKFFLLNMRSFGQVFHFESNLLFISLKQSLETNTPIDEKVLLFVSPSNEPKKKYKPDLSKAASIVPISMPPIKAPSNTFDESQWFLWEEETMNLIMMHSTSRTISSCFNFSERYYQLKEALLPVAYVLYYLRCENSNDNMPLKIIRTIFESRTVPKSLIRHFLTIYELFDILGIQFPVSYDVLANYAEIVDMIALAIRLNENMFLAANMKSINKLVVYNQRIGFPLVANGLLKHGKQNGILFEDKSLAENLGLWEEALIMYDKELHSNGKDQRLLNGKIKCLAELSQYYSIVNNDFQTIESAFVPWALWHINKIDEFLRTKISPSSGNQIDIMLSIVKSIINLDYSSVESQFLNAQSSILQQVFPVISHDFSSSYRQICSSSILETLLEVVLFKKLQEYMNSPNGKDDLRINERLKSISSIWLNRFSHIPNDPQTMHSFLCIFSLVLKPDELFESYVKCANFAFHSKRSDILRSILDVLYNNGFSKSLEFLFLSAYYQILQNIEPSFDELVAFSHNKDLSHADRARIHTYLGEAYFEKGKFDDSLIHFGVSIHLLPSSIEVWKNWSQINMVLYDNHRNGKYLYEQFSGLLNSLALSTDDSLEYTLQIMSILFLKGSTELYTLFTSKLNEIPNHVWLSVLPQIIARAQSSDDTLKNILCDLILSVGISHPQVVLYSLMIPIRSDFSGVSTVITDIQARLKSFYSSLVNTMTLFSNELIRIAVSWFEIWSSGLDSASRDYMKGDYDSMIQTLDSLYVRIGSRPETLHEVSFIREFGSDIYKAKSWYEEFKSNRDIGSISMMWEMFSSLFDRLHKKSSEFNELQLTDISPMLCHSMLDEMCIPGTYSFQSPKVLISHVKGLVKVIESKQKPRKISFCGSDGIDYMFLLKGHEDTRLDERVMQFFDLLNSLVSKSRFAEKSYLRITTYKVTPLTKEVGLIGWVPNCTTLYDMIKNYRERNGIPIECEYNEAIRNHPDYYNLSIDERVVAFRKGLRSTPGDDLRKILYNQSNDSNHWIERRASYTSSLSMTSVSGYILGLGDRHMSNIMIDLSTAKLIHIDFGDCFEVSMHRAEFPEKVPFRLTRMLTNALEVSGVDGSFRSLSEIGLSLCRESRTQLLGLLEVFIYDPLIQWTNGGTNAIECVSRIESKLKGNDFEFNEIFPIETQVSKLIDQATDYKNLCQMFRGWFPWW